MTLLGYCFGYLANLGYYPAKHLGIIVLEQSKSISVGFLSINVAGIA